MTTPLLTDTQKASFVSIALQHMPTFWEPITIYKEPQAIIANAASATVYPGYRETSNEQNFTYQPVYQTFSGLVFKMKNRNPVQLYQINQQVWDGNVRLKVEKDASDYITNGKTEKISAGGKEWNVISGPETQNYLTLTYYYFDLKELH